jgi:hypothetical protein
MRRQAVGYVALFVALGGVSYAAIPDTGGTVHGCYDTSNPTNGAFPLYVIDKSTTADCPAGRSQPMTALDWNGTGPPGPQGPKGEEGPKGEQGPPAETNGGKPQGPPTGLNGLGAPQPQDLAGVSSDTLVHKEGKCPPETYDAPPFSRECTQQLDARCTKAKPVAINGGWAIFYFGHDVTSYATTRETLSMSELYNQRLPGAGRGGVGPQGWTAAVHMFDFGAFIGFGNLSNFPGGWHLHVWALCGTTARGAQLGIKLPK